MSNQNMPTFSDKLLLGFAQVLLWSGSYFLLSVLAKPISLETGWPPEKIFGALSLSFIVSGFALPFIGRWIEKSYDHFAIQISGATMAVGLCVMAVAKSYEIFLLAWAIIGLGMGLGHYDSLYANIGKSFGKFAPKTIVHVTLISSLTPSLAWMSTTLLLDHYGWRYTCFIYAAILAVIIYPLHYFIFKKPNKINYPPCTIQSYSCVFEKYDKKLYWILMIQFVLGAMVTTGVVVYLIDVLKEKELSPDEVLKMVGLLGPCQAGARLIDLFLPRLKPVETGVISSLAMFAAIGLIYIIPSMAMLAVILFGMGNGLRSILRGTLPMYVFGEDNYASLIGKLGRWPMIAQAMTPFIGGVVFHKFGVGSFLSCFGLLAFINLMLAIVLIMSNKNDPKVKIITKIKAI